MEGGEYKFKKKVVRRRFLARMCSQETGSIAHLQALDCTQFTFQERQLLLGLKAYAPHDDQRDAEWAYLLGLVEARARRAEEEVKRAESACVRWQQLCDQLRYGHKDDVAPDA